MKPTLLGTLAVCCLMLFAVADLSAQKKKKQASSPESPVLQFDEKLWEGMEWRSIGPYRGGRSAAVTGVPGKANLFYFGATGGGVWRTTDGGSNWKNISDGFFGGSIGAVAVSEYDNNVIYAGGGEKTVRGNVSYGYGMWRSVDAGKTWKHIGLSDSRHISRVRIHPRNPDLVYAAVMGNLFAPSEERGVYRSQDGGETWTRVLFANQDAGAVDLVMDPNNPRILYASTWKIRRTPYSLSSGGEGSGIWKSVDAGNTWEELSAKPGFPKGPLGIIGLAVSPANSERVWALAEAKDGGVFRSENGGDTWKKINDSRALRQRAWYYTRIYADPQDAEKVYVMNVSYHKSTDGGKTFTSHRAPHGDHHDLWIAPEDPDRMIIADDGGAQVSFDGGENWSTYENQPTAQFYRLATDNHFPYRIYAAQQDNSAIRIQHRTDGYSITEKHWDVTAGFESAHLAVDPTDNEIVYGGGYGGYLTRKNHRTGGIRAINVWPDNPMGYGAEGMKYRFQWNFPIFFSPHHSQKLYTASNHLHMSEDGGDSWKIISPDLTRNDSARLVSSGGPITQDNTGVEYYCTIFAAAESPQEEGLIWVGSDDGLIHLTKDGGENWMNITPKGMPEWMMINSIEINPFVKGGAYIAGTRYKMGDFSPYLFKTDDYGNTWETITNGIETDHFTRVVRADPKRQGLLYAGTETGIYVSFDDGKNWQPFQMNVPIVPITDLAVKNDNLIAATQGRSIWILDDLTPFHDLNPAIAASPAHLYAPMPSYRMGGGSSKAKNAGTNHPGGVMIHFFLAEEPDSTVKTKLEMLEADGTLIRSFPGKEKGAASKWKPKAGLNRFVWDMRYEAAEKFKGMVLWWAQMSGPKAVSGTYKARLTVGETVQEVSFEIVQDPRSEAKSAELQAQFDQLLRIRDKLTESHEAIIGIRDAKTQVEGVIKRVKADSTQSEVAEMARSIINEMTEIEKALYQTKNRSNQDPLNFPIRLTNKLAHVAALSGVGDAPPTQQALAVESEMTTAINQQLKAWEAIQEEKIPALNQLVKENQVDAIQLDKGDTDEAN